MKILTHWLRTYLPVLDVDDDQLAEDLTLRGIAVEGVFELNDAAGDSDAALFDMDITTNRVDAMNHYGIAREAAAIYNVPLHPLDASLPARKAAATPFPVRIDAPDLCGRFTAQVIRGVNIKPTEGVVSHYFAELGQKQISNAVDITNFVLLGMGHPTHAFDLDKVEGGIVVRRAHAGEQIRLLDGTTRTLVVEDLVVADQVKALALAGLMGGFDSMITAETKNILVEAAWFSPASIRASSRRHLIHTDASHRFERGADFAAAPVANALVSKHILAACGGVLEGDLVDVVIAEHAAVTALRPAIALSVKEVQRHLGTTLAPEGITAALVRQYLGALGCKLEKTGDDTYAVTLPSWRLDLTREIDLIEEIARVYGYNRFANTLPTPGVVIAHPTARAERAIRARLLALGFSEALSSTFASAAESAFFASQVAAVALENPLSEEAANLRPSLLPGMVTMLAHNVNRDVLTARLFETGAIFSGSAASVQEALSLSLGLTGQVAATPLHNAQDAPFFELKGAIESVLSLFDTPAAAFSTASVPAAFEAGRSASVMLAGAPIAHLGQLAVGESARRKLRQPVYLAELDLARLLTYPLRQHTARELSRFQAVERDFSFTFADATAWQTISAAVHKLSIAELTSLTAVEIFRDAKKLPGHYSVLIRTVFQSQERTLVDEDLTAWSSAIIGALEVLGGVIRS
jgi:phenylalanyl-tRNA synthetase beta chain